MTTVQRRLGGCHPGSSQQAEANRCQISRKGSQLVVIMCRLVNRFGGLCEILEACQKLIERHPILVVELGGRKVFPELLVNKSILMRIEVSNLQECFDFLLARRIENAQ